MSPLFNTAAKLLIKNFYDMPAGVRAFSLSRDGNVVKIRSYGGEHGTMPLDDYHELIGKIDRNVGEQSTRARHFALHFHLVANGIIN